MRGESKRDGDRRIGERKKGRAGERGSRELPGSL